MTIDYFKAAREMKNVGSFAASIAEAYFCADSNNQTILTTAFYSLFKRFDPTQSAYSQNVNHIIDHIAACSPCAFNSIVHFADTQLDNVEIGALIQLLIDDGKIHFDHESQAYSINY